MKKLFALAWLVAISPAILASSAPKIEDSALPNCAGSDTVVWQVPAIDGPGIYVEKGSAGFGLQLNRDARYVCRSEALSAHSRVAVIVDFAAPVVSQGPEPVGNASSASAQSNCTDANPMVWVIPTVDGAGIYVARESDGYGLRLNRNARYACRADAQRVHARASTLYYLDTIVESIATLLSGSSSVYGVDRGATPAPTARPRTRGFATLRVYFATDRDRERDATGVLGPIASFGAARSVLTFGEAEVSIPDDHKFGNVESPPTFLYIRLRQPDPKRDMVILDSHVESASSFYRALKLMTFRSKAKEALLFIHGFNVPFEDALLRTGQLAHDLTLDGPAICYSWPSQGTTWGYPVDNVNAVWTAKHLSDVIVGVSSKTGVTNIHIVAHSMGNSALAYSLKLLAAGKQTQAIHDIEMAAPDIDAQIFTEQLATNMRSTARRITVYASARDTALAWSHKYNGGLRLGDAQVITLVPGMDVIDATNVDTDFLGHGYFADSLALMTDLHQVFEGKPLPRYPLGERRALTGTYYAFP